MTQFTATELLPMVKHSLIAGLNPYIAGSPGIGKSDLVRHIAESLNLYVVDFRLSTADPTDMNGLVNIDRERNKATFTPFDTFPLVGDEIPEGYSGWLIFLDELPSAAPSLQVAAYKLLQDKMVGTSKLHPNVHIMAAGNLVTDGAIAGTLGTAMQSRLHHFEMRVSVEDWLDWAYKAGLDGRVTAYIEYAEEQLHVFNPQHNEKTFRCPRTWHNVAKFLATGLEVDVQVQHAIEGIIGAAGAREFRTFCEVGKDLPSFEELLANPTTIAVPEDPATLYFLAGTMSNKIDIDNISDILPFINRLPIEFQIILIGGLIKRIPKIQANKDLKQWLRTNARDLMD